MLSDVKTAVKRAKATGTSAYASKSLLFAFDEMMSIA